MDIPSRDPDAPELPATVTARTRRPPTAVAWAVAPPLLAWLFARVVVTLTSSSDANVFTFSSAAWRRWDSNWYLEIAKAGRTFYACPETYRKFFPLCHWYGSAGWLPGYPYFIRFTADVTRLSQPSAAVLVSSGFALAALALMWNVILRDVAWTKSLPLLLIFAVFPGSVYDYALFPMSVALTAIVLTIVALKYHRPGLGALALAVAVGCYPSALYVLPAYALGIWLCVPPERRRLALGWIVVPLLPLVAMFIHDDIALKHWNAYLLEQKQFGTTLFPPRLPWVQLWDVLVRETQKMQTNTQVYYPKTAHFVKRMIAVQAALASALVLAPGVIWWRYRRASLDLATEVYPIVAGAFVWIGILLSGVGGGWTRAIVLAAPSCVAFRRLPTWSVWCILAVTTVVTALMSHSFFTGAIL